MHEGKAYRKTERFVREGDELLIVTQIDDEGELTEGKVYKINRVDYDGDPRVYDDDGYDVWVSKGNYAILEPVTVYGPVTLLDVTPPVEKSYTLAVTDGVLAEIQQALEIAGADFRETRNIIASIRKQQPGRR